MTDNPSDLVDEQHVLEENERKAIENLLSIVNAKKNILEELLSVSEEAIEREGVLKRRSEGGVLHDEALEALRSLHQDISQEEEDLTVYESKHEEETETLRELQEEQNTVEKIQTRLERELEQMTSSHS